MDEHGVNSPIFSFIKNMDLVKGGYMDESRETVKRTIEATVEVNTDEAMEKTEKLIALLVTANSLADELAVTLSDLKLDVKI